MFVIEQGPGRYHSPAFRHKFSCVHEGFEQGQHLPVGLVSSETPADTRQRRSTDGDAGQARASRSRQLATMRSGQVQLDDLSQVAPDIVECGRRLRRESQDDGTFDGGNDQGRQRARVVTIGPGRD
jgi:hypothetical protein